MAQKLYCHFDKKNEWYVTDGMENVAAPGIKPKTFCYLGSYQLS